jgi:hypothetical protein
MAIRRFEGPSAQPAGPYRRFFTRFEPVRREACLAWWGPSESLAMEPVAIQHFALLLDISHTGASLALDRVPDGDSNVWLRMDGDEASDWTEADIVGVTATARGPHVVRLKFRGPCSFETLQGAICG